MISVIKHRALSFVCVVIVLLLASLHQESTIWTYLLLRGAAVDSVVIHSLNVCKKRQSIRSIHWTPIRRLSFIHRETKLDVPLPTIFRVQLRAGFCWWGPGANIEDGSSLVIHWNSGSHKRSTNWTNQYIYLVGPLHGPLDPQIRPWCNLIYRIVLTSMD